MGQHQQGVIALADPTAVGGEMALVTEQPPRGAPAVRACQPIGVEVAFEPQSAEVIIQELGDREVNHVAMIPHPARWLHMSQKVYHLALSWIQHSDMAWL